MTFGKLIQKGITKVKNFNNKDITLFISSLAGGGAENVCTTLANSLSERGWSVTLLVMNLKEDDVNYHRVNNKVSVVNLKVTKARFLLPYLLRYFYKNKPKKIICFTYELAIQSIVARAFYHGKLTLISRNINSLSSISKNTNSLWRKIFVYPLIKRLYKMSDIVVNQCHSMKESLMKTIDIKEDKCKVIYNPVNSMFSDINVDGQRSNFLLCVGRLEKQKAFDLAIESFSRIANDFPHLQLKIIGEGSQREFLENIIEKEGLKNRVFLLGFQKNMAEYYSSAQNVLLTSRFEGFPNVLIESISCGTPIVSINCDSGPSEIVNNINGHLVNIRSSEAFSEAVRENLNTDYNHTHIKDDAKRFSVENIVTQWEAVISSV